MGSALVLIILLSLHVRSSSPLRLLSTNAAVARARSYPSLGEGLDRDEILLQERLRGGLHGREQVRIAHQIGHAHVRQARLTSAEQLAGSAQFEIATGDDEAVV